MYDIASSILQQKLAQVPGVGQVTVGGGALPAVRVDVNPVALNSTGLGLEDVRASLAAANANRPKGEVADIKRVWSLSTTDQLLQGRRVPAARRQLPRTAPRSAWPTSPTSPTRSRTSARPASPTASRPSSSSSSASRAPTSSTPWTASGPSCPSSGPRSRRPSTCRCSSTPPGRSGPRSGTSRSRSSSPSRLVILVVFIFLRSARSTFIPSVAVPISLIGTFGVMYLLHYSIDNLSLMALTIATGFVVDDAIVVIENITRHLEAGMSPLAAALQGGRGDRLHGPLDQPVAGGRLHPHPAHGRHRRPALPRVRRHAVGRHRRLAGRLADGDADDVRQASAAVRQGAADGRLYRASERWFAAILRGYERALGWVLRHQRLTLAVTLATMAATIFLYVKIPKGFFPQQDTGRLTGRSSPTRTPRSRPSGGGSTEFIDTMTDDPAVENVGRIPRRRHRQRGPDVREPEAQGRARRDGRPGHRAPAREARPRPRGHALFAVGPGRARRRPLRRGPVPVHAPGRRPGRAVRVGAPRLREAAPAQGAHRRQQRPAEQRPRGRR